MRGWVRRAFVSVQWWGRDQPPAGQGGFEGEGQEGEVLLWIRLRADGAYKVGQGGERECGV